MRIDAHHHLWDLAVRDQPWTRDVPALRGTFTADELRPALDRNAVDATVVVRTVAVPQETPELPGPVRRIFGGPGRLVRRLAALSEPAKYVQYEPDPPPCDAPHQTPRADPRRSAGQDLALASGDPHVRAVVGWADLTGPGLADRLAEPRELPGGSRLVGIRHGIEDEPDPDWAARPEVRRADCPNVAVKLSGLVTRTGADPARALRPYADVLLETVGPHRLMYGSDWPVCLLAAGYDDVPAVAETLTGRLSAAEREAVFGKTAARCYGIAA